MIFSQRLFYDYCIGLNYFISKQLLNQLQLIQNACAKTVFKYDHLGKDFSTLHWLNVCKHVIFKIGLLAYTSVNGIPHCAPVSTKNVSIQSSWSHIKTYSFKSALKTFYLNYLSMT